MAYLKSFFLQVEYNMLITRRLQSGSANQNKNQFILLEFLDLVDQHYAMNFTVQKYAEILHISRRQLSGLTRLLLKKSPSQIIHDKIIKQAKTMLVNTDLSVSYIGKSLGFSDVSYFVKYFKRYNNCSPAAFRNFGKEILPVNNY